MKRPQRSRQTRLRSRQPRVELLEIRLVPTLLGNQLFPSDNPWNQKISNAPVAANSDTLVASIGLSSPVHPDFGAGTYAGSYIGIPFNVVSGTQPKVNVVIDAYASESDLVPIPIPSNAVIEGDPLPASQNTGDRHLIVYDQSNNIVYETFNTHRPSEEPDGQWHADSEAVWDLKKDTFRTAGFTSADAAGLPILPGLARPDEVLDQHLINHALRFTVPQSRNTYVFPASHEAGSNDPSLPRMGERFRLKASFDISGYSAADQVILQALKDYGMIVADNGSGWYISGQPSDRWDNNDLHALTQIPGSAFEAVDLTPRVSGLTQTSGLTTGGTVLTINGLDFSGGAGQTQVFFGQVAATAISVVSDTQIQVTAPAQAAGTVDVTVQSPYGTSAVTAADQFTFSTPIPQAGQLQFSARSYTVNKSAAAASITVTRIGGSAGAVAVQFATSDGTATAGTDYSTASGTLNFADGQTSVTFSVPILQEPTVEGQETINLTLVNPTGGAILGAGNAVLSIVDDGATLNQRFVGQVYLDLLGRPVEAGGLAFWTGLLNQGFSRDQLLLQIEASAEYRIDEIEGLYAKFLHRAADAGGLNAFVGFLGAGGSFEQVEAFITGSTEYFQNRGAGTNDGFLDALYQDALGRSVDPAGRSIFDQVLSAGASPTQVAAAIFGSSEYQQDLVQSFYLRYLHRPADAGGLNGFVNALQHGARDQDVIAAILASGEYSAGL